VKLDTIMAEIKIDKQLFQERLSHFISAWKADKRSGDAVFGGASSMLILMGKTEESSQFQKNNAIHVCTRVIIIVDGRDANEDIVLVIRLRVPSDAVSVHDRSSIRGDDGEEG